MNGKQNTLKELVKILEKGSTLGFDFSELISKLNKLESSISDDIIKIVLLSCFSDGKTSTIAGLIGNVDDTMNIDADESSDSINVYETEIFGRDYQIVDTPGLFGTKEKEIDGKNIKFSEITERYISEAHIILYLCDAVTPLKDSHSDFIRKLMRDFNKINSTIFVINKLDQAGFDMLDEEDILAGCRIKKANLIQRLKDTINLTSEEESSLNIVCISADPKGKGISKWLETPEKYVERSHISNLKDTISDVLKHSNKEELQLEAINATIVDTANNVSLALANTVQVIHSSLVSIKDIQKNMMMDFNLLGQDLQRNKTELENRLAELRLKHKTLVRSADMSNISNIIDDYIGTSDGKIDYWVIKREINKAVRECTEANLCLLDSRMDNFEKDGKVQDGVIKELAGCVSNALSKVNISGETVKRIRDVVAKNHKFKPWGAIKLGAKVTKGLQYAGKGISAGLEIWEFYKTFRDQKKLAELKNTLSEGIDELIKEVYALIDSEEEYYEVFAPSYISIREELESRNEVIIALETKEKALGDYENTLKDWVSSQVKDVEYQKI